jgi:hypothetical protein
MLEDDPQRLVSTSPAIAHISALVRDALADHHDRDLDPQIVSAVIVSAVLGWRLFQPFVTVAGELTDRDPERLPAEFAAGLRAIVAATTGLRSAP